MDISIKVSTETHRRLKRTKKETGISIKELVSRGLYAWEVYVRNKKDIGS